jgi:butyryl-CoA dehydrogenase
VAWQWLVQALAAQRALGGTVSEAEGNFYRGKLHTFQFFYSYELPKIEGLAKRLMESDGLTVDMPERFFSD